MFLPQLTGVQALYNCPSPRGSQSSISSNFVSTLSAPAAPPASASTSTSTSFIHCNSKSEFNLPNKGTDDFIQEATRKQSLLQKERLLNSTKEEETSTTSSTSSSSKCKFIKTRIPPSILSSPSSSLAYSTSNSIDCSSSSSSSSSRSSSSRSSSSSSNNTTTTTTNHYSKQINQSLNLHLGLPFNLRKVRIVRIICKVMSYFLSFCENHLFHLWDTKVPLYIRQAVSLKRRERRREEVFHDGGYNISSH